MFIAGQKQAAARRHTPLQEKLLFLSFPYVYPEPVLVNRSFSICKWRKRRMFSAPEQRHAPDAAADRAQALHDCRLRKTPLFWGFSLCLSRACLGKMMHLCINCAKSGVYRTVSMVVVNVSAPPTRSMRPPPTILPSE